MALTSGQVLQDRYRLVSRLGQGGMGAVYRAWDTRLKISVALKEMVPQPGLDQQMLEALHTQFRQEAQILARLSHPHLVRVGDFFEQDDKTYLTMDFVEGESLADLIRRQGALPEAYVLAWGEQLLSAMAYCHGQGIIHRDIKPQNVVIRSDGQAVLVDFGLVKLWNPSDPQTRTAMRGMGTPEYAPPEQYDATSGHTDPRTDVYSAGATLYHALTGQAPPTATMRVANPSRFPPVRALNPAVSPRTEAVVTRATELALERRFTSAWEMAAALRGEAPVAPVQPVTQGKLASAAGAAAGVAAGAGTLGVTAGQGVTRRGAGAAGAAVHAAGAASEDRKGLPVWVWGLVGAAGLVLLGAVVIIAVLLANGGNRAARTERATETAVAIAAAATTDVVVPADTPAPALTPATTAEATAGPATAGPTAEPSDTPGPGETPSPSQTPSPSPTPSATVSAEPTTAPASGALVNFEDFGSWRRGDQPNGDFTQTQEQVHTGGYAGKLSYVFPNTDQDFVVFSHPLALRGTPDSFGAWVYGDGTGHYVNFWVKDAQDEIWSVALGKVGGPGWQQMVGKLDPSLAWPNGHINGPDNGVVDYPVSFYALVVDRPQAGEQKGVIYFDDFSAWQSGGSPTATPEPSGPTATAAPAATSTPAASAGPLSFPTPTYCDSYQGVEGGYDCTVIVHISGGSAPFKVYKDSVTATSGTDQRDYPLVFTESGCHINHTITVESNDGQSYSASFWINSPWCE